MARPRRRTKGKKKFAVEARKVREAGEQVEKRVNWEKKETQDPEPWPVLFHRPRVLVPGPSSGGKQSLVLCCRQIWEAGSPLPLDGKDALIPSSHIQESVLQTLLSQELVAGDSRILLPQDPGIHHTPHLLEIEK